MSGFKHRLRSLYFQILTDHGVHQTLPLLEEATYLLLSAELETDTITPEVIPSDVAPLLEIV